MGAPHWESPRNNTKEEFLMSEANKAVVRQYFARWGTQAAARESLAADFVAHMPGVPAPMNREAFVQFQGVFVSAFPDFALTVEDQIAEGDKVANRVVFRGTHSGDFQGIPPTGKRVMVTAITIERVAGGKLVEHWIEMDALGLLQQLGVVPRPGQ
jgi:predicted ester cyclase